MNQDELQALRAKRLVEAKTDKTLFAQLCGIDPDTTQRRVLESTSSHLLLCCSRQWGKSTVASIAALHEGIYNPGCLGVLVSPSQRQSAELLLKVQRALSNLRGLPAPVESNKTSLELKNGSRIVSLPASEDTIRGYSAPTFIIEDEAAFVPDPLHDAVRPMLAVSRGRLWLLSSPNGKSGHFYQAWENGGARWHRERVRAEDNPRIDRAWLAGERAEYESRGLFEHYRQEYEAEFIDAATGRVYEWNDAKNGIAALPDAQRIAPWHYILGVDPGVIDDTGYAIVAWREHDPVAYLVAAYKTRNTTPDDMALEVQQLSQVYKFDAMVCDQGGLGKGFSEHARERYGLPLEAAQKHDKIGYIAMMNGALRAAKLLVVAPQCSQLIDEWRQLSWTMTGAGMVKAVENPSQANHAADAALYAWREVAAYAQRPLPEQPRTHEQIIKAQMAEYWQREEAKLQEQKMNVIDEFAWLDQQ